MLQLSSPFLMPRVLHNDNTYLSYRTWEIANFFVNFFHLDPNRYANIQNLVRRQVTHLVVDPRTVLFQAGGHIGKPTYEALPYAGPPGQTLSTNALGGASLVPYVRQVLDEQRRCGGNVLVPPYFLFSSTRDPWFAISEQAAQEASNLNEGLPLLMFVAIRGSILLNHAEIDALVARLAACPVDGYYLLVADAPEASMTVSQVRGYRRLVRGLNLRPVIPAQVGRLGLALMADGAAGYCSGFAKLGNVTESSFGPGGGGPGQTTRYYFHTMQLNIYSNRADEIAQARNASPDYPCSCGHCNNQLPNALPSMNRTLHYIDRRLDELNALSQVPIAQRPTAIAGMFQSAVDTLVSVQAELQSNPFGMQSLRTSDFSHVVTIRDALP